MNYSAEALNQLEAGQLDEFQKNLELALKNDSDDLLFSLAEELYSLGFTDDAKKIYEQLLVKYPEEGQLKIQLAELAIDEQNDEQALEYLSTIAKNDPEYVQALLVEADLYQTQELFEISEQKLLEAHSLAPEESVIDFALGEFYFATRNFNKAINIYLRLIKAGTLEVAGVNLVQRLGVAYAQSGKFEQALGYLSQIKPVDMNPDTRFELAFTQFNLHDYSEAIKNFEELREADPQYSSLYPYLADAYIQQNDNSAALRAIQEGLGVDQYNEQIWLKAAAIAQLVGDDELVQQYLSQGLEIDPDNLEIITQLANWQIKHEKFQAVVDLLSPLQEEEQFDAVLSWNLATANNRLGNIKAAKHNYELASTELIDDTDFLKEAGMFYRSLGEVELARNYFNRYLRLVPGDFEIETLLEDL